MLSWSENSSAIEVIRVKGFMSKFSLQNIQLDEFDIFKLNLARLVGRPLPPTHTHTLYILFYNSLVTRQFSWNLVTSPKIYIELILWIFIFKIWTDFCSVSTFSKPGVINKKSDFQKNLIFILRCFTFLITFFQIVPLLQIHKNT